MELESKKFDVAVVGSGVVGCAVLHEFTSLGLSCILCEKEENLVTGASSGNSGTLHTGFDAPLDSLELRCLQRARDLNESFYSKNNIPYRKSGGFIVAWNEKDLERLPELVDKAHRAGVTDVRQITASELFEKEPWLSHNALGAVHVPGESLVDPWRVPIALANLAVNQNATILTSCHVTGGKRQENDWQLSTSQGPITASVVVNCAGLYGDELETIHRQSPFTIKPRKGQYAVFSKSASKLLNSIIFPAPTPKTKGVLLFPTVYGNIVVGPTAEDQLDRSNAEINETVIETLVAHAHTILPSLKEHAVIGTYAGLRPATEFKDYCIECQPENGWITVGGIRSTGLSACLGIAKHVASFLPSLGFEKPNKPPRSGLLKADNNWKITHPITKFGLSTDDRKTDH
ncbi:glycerol 3-phosphate dehydrogenase-like [Oculina patagonica]